MRDIAKVFKSTAHTRKAQIALNLGATLVYILAFFPSYGLVTRSAIALSIIPIITAANTFGLWGGSIAGLLSIPSNALLLTLAGEPDLSLFLGRNFWFSHVVFILIGVAIGYFKNIRSQLERELYRQKQIETALRESDERFQSLIGSMDDVVFTLDCEGRHTGVFGRWVEKAGLTPEVFLGKTASEVLGAQAGKVHDAANERALSGENVVYEWSVENAGETQHYHTSLSPILNAQDEVVGIVGVGRDITARRRVEELLRAQRDLGLALSAIRGLKETLRLCVETAIHASEMDCGGVYLVDEETGNLDLAFHTGLPPAFIKGASHYDADSVNVHLVMAGKPIYSQHLELDLPSDESVRREGLRAFALIPISYENRVIACFNIASHTLDEVPDFARTALETIATQIGNAISRAKTEEALRQSQANLQALFDSLEDFLFVLDLQGSILHVNPVVVKRLGYSEAELLEKSVLQVHPPERREEAAAIVAGMVAGKTDMCPVPLMTRDGSQIPVETKITQGRWGDRKALFGISRDITERTRAEKERRERERFLALLNDITRAALDAPDLSTMLQTLADRLGALFDADSCYLTLWDETRQTTIPVAAYGQQRETYGSMHLEPGEATMTESVLNVGHPLVAQDVYNTPYLSSRIATMFPDRSLLGLPLIAGDQKLGAALIAFNKIHRFTPDEIARGEQAASQIALAVAKARLVEELEKKVAARTAEILVEKEKSETILRSVGDAIAVVDLEMQIDYLNDAFTHLTGYLAPEALGQSVGVLIGQETSEQSRQALHLAIAEGQVWQGEATIRRQNGRIYEAAMTVAPVRDVDGKVTGYVTSHRDITRLKELERARSQFMTNVSHELRTPVANIKLYAHLLQRGQPPVKTTSYLQVLMEQTNRLEHLIQDILEMTALDSGQGTIIWEPILPNTMIQNSLERYHDQAKTSGLILEAAPLPSSLPTVRGDPVRLTQALGELVDNAITFTPAGGHVTIQVGTTQEDTDHWVTISVRDTGPGISQEEQERVFDRFFRGTLAQAGHIPGTGLGLSIVQEIMHTHGGRVTVKSNPGQGSTFTLWLQTAPQVSD